MSQKDKSNLRHIISMLGVGREIHSPASTSSLVSWIDAIKDHLYAVIRMGEQENAKLFSYPVQVVITDSSAIEACALTQDSQDIIVITEGLLQSLRHVIYALLADPRVLKSVGDASHEKEQCADLSSVNLPVPRCPTRQEAATEILMKACEFVLLHELGHLFYGHPEFVGRGGGEKTIFEFGMTKRSNPFAQRYQRILEFQADRYAADVTLSLSFDSLWEGQAGFLFADPGQNSDHSVAASIEEKIAASQEEKMISNWAIATNLVFHLLSSVRANGSTHPHPNWRYMAVLMSASVTYASTYRVHSQEAMPVIRTNPNRFLDICNDVRRQVADGWQYTGRIVSVEPEQTEQEFRSDLHEAVLMLGKLKHRFDASRIP